WGNSRLTPRRSASRMRGLSAHGPSSSNSMYAVIATGGKQYRVTKDGVLRVEKLDAEPGATVEFGEVLLVGEGADVKLGKPTLKGGKVLATVVRQGVGGQVQAPRALPAAEEPPTVVHRGEGHGHQRRLSAVLQDTLSHGTQKGRRQYQERP